MQEAESDYRTLQRTMQANVYSAGDNGHDTSSPNGNSRKPSSSMMPPFDSTVVGTNIPVPSPSMALSTRSSWLPILESANNQLVLYNSTSHALTITPSSLLPVRRLRYDPSSHSSIPTSTQLAPAGTRTRSLNSSRMTDNEEIALASPVEKACPWCSRPYPSDPANHINDLHSVQYQSQYARDGLSRRAPNYFKLLEQANHEIQSRPPSPPLLPGSHTSISIRLDEIESPIAPGTPEKSAGPRDGTGVRTRLGLNTTIGGGGSESPIPGTPKRRFGENSMAQGYFTAFFKEERRLGMGANGTVYLCQHVLDGNYLGHFAVKKIAVGHSHEYLLRILKEVRLLETLRHPNIISYHHSWLETTRFSSFGPSIPTLHVLMEWAECGSLDDLIDARHGRRGSHEPGTGGGGDLGNDEDGSYTTRSERIRAFRANRKDRGSPTTDSKSKKTRASAGVHLLSAEEIKSFMIDIVSGLTFLHDRSILHLDLKLGNVLLTKDEDRIIPRAMLSDFGTSQDALQTPRIRTGNTGTVEYSAPEALQLNASGKLQQVDSRSDMWSLGMILHKLIFFRLPYPDIDPTDVNGIEREVLAYPGWKAAADPGVVASCKRRGLPRELLLLLEGLLCRNPRERPSSDRVLSALKEGNLEPHTRVTKKRDVSSSRPRRGSSSSPSIERSGFPPEALTLTLIKPSDMPPPDTLTDEEEDLLSGSTSPILANLKPGSRRPSFAESLTTLLLPAPVQVLRRRRWRNVRMTLLVLKIVSLSRACRGGSPAIWIQALATGLAVIDIWKDEEADGDEMDDLRLSAALCFVHFVLLGLIRWSRLGLCVA